MGMAIVSDKMQDWHKKVSYLNNKYQAISPLDFYCAIGLDELLEDFSLCGMHSQAPAGSRFQRYSDIMEMLTVANMRRDAYVYPAIYYGYAKESLLHTLSCIYIDLDHVDADDLRRLCSHNFYGHKPSCIVNSGNGVHLVYILTKKINTYNWAKFLLRRIHRGLLEAFAKAGFDADLGTGVSHAYRVVGSRTKLGQICTAYKVGEAVDIEELSKSVGIIWQHPQHGKTKKDKVSAAPKAYKRLYSYMMRNIAARTVEGHRYMSLFAMACVGYKCGVAADQIQADLVSVAQALKFSEKEAEHAFTVCNPKKAITVKAATLENWLGWNFDRATKRNGRTMKEHLALIAQKKVSTNRKRVWDYLEKCPQANISKIARALTMDRKTVSRYFHEKMEQMRQRAEKVKKAAKSVNKGIRAIQNKNGDFSAFIPAPFGGGLVPVLSFRGLFRFGVKKVSCSRLGKALIRGRPV